MESNHRPLSYQDSVLPLNYTRVLIRTVFYHRTTRASVRSRGIEPRTLHAGRLCVPFPHPYFTVHPAGIEPAACPIPIGPLRSTPTPLRCACQGLNLGPLACHASALPLSYTRKGVRGKRRVRSRRCGGMQALCRSALSAPPVYCMPHCKLRVFRMQTALTQEARGFQEFFSPLQS